MDKHSQPNPAVLRQSPPLLNPVVLILLLPTLTLLLIFLLIISFISYSPNIKTKGLDYLNIILLLFAILCGLFPKRNASAETKSRPLDSSQSHKSPDPMAESGSRLIRNSSYPDIRQTTDWETGDNQLRFFDDFEIEKYKSYIRRSEAAEKVIPVDTFEVVRFPSEDKKLNISDMKIATNIADVKIKRKWKKKIRNIREGTENVQKIFSPAPPPPPPLSFYNIFKKGNKTKRVHSLLHSSPPPSPRSIFNDIFKSGSKSKRFQNQSKSVPPPPPPPPPPFSSKFNNMFKTGNKSKPFHNQSKSPPTHPSSIFNDIIKFGTKSKRFQSLSVPPPPPPSSIFNNLFNSGSKRYQKRYPKKSPSAPPPAPPPPPPPSSLFNNIFKSRNKSKIYQKKSPSAPPPPPPPPPPPSYLFNNKFKSGCKSKRYNSASSSIFDNIFESSSKSNRFSTAIPPAPPRRRSSGRPPLPVKTENLYGGGDKTPEISGAHVPERSEEMNGGDLPRNTVMCPSPDVNMKADSFIARLKGEWRLEKINSVREKMNMSPRSSPR